MNGVLSKPIKDLSKEELDIIRSLNSAREEIRIKKNKFIQFDIKFKEVKPESIENSLEYLYEHLMAHIYKNFCEKAKQKNQTVKEAVEGLCAVANHVRTICNARKPDFINNVWNMRFSEIPEGDPLFEKFKQCYNKEENLSRIKNLKSKFKHII